MFLGLFLLLYIICGRVVGMAGENWDKYLAMFRERLEREGKSVVTVKGYLDDLSLFVKWYLGTFGKENASVFEVKEVDLLAYKSHLQNIERFQPSTINRRVATLRMFFSFLHKDGILDSFVASNLRPLELQPVRAPEVLSHAHVLRLFGAIDRSSVRGKRDFAIIQLFVQCGLRLGEVTSIRIGDFDLSERKGVLRVQCGKGGRFREVPLNKTARFALAEYLHVKPALPGVDHLFVSQKGTLLSKRAIFDIVKKYLRMIGSGDNTVHSLRHLFATSLYNKHKDIVLVKEALGHKSIQTTLRYARKSKAEVQQALESLDSNIFL
jgi:site-specific recombinase XerD